MSVLIPNMKMPEHCGECRFAVDGWCYAYGKPNIDALANDGRTNFCPLIKVPPHGRLIDADALRTLYEKWHSEEQLGIDIDACHVPIPVIRQNIDDAPTILPEEEGEI